ncbi:MAG: restriction endonuclease subunit S [Ruminococcus sp.]|jgi:type I restriction enzyme S subunit
MKIYLLGNIADVQTGPFGSQLHKEDYVEFGTPMVTVEHLGNRVFTKQNLPMISDSDKKRLNKYVLNEGDIVFSRVGSVDRCSYVDNKHLGWMFSGRCLRIRPRNVVYPLYLYYYFCMENTKQFIRNIAVGATMPSINTKLMEDLKVPLPTMEMQQKIASILSALDDKIELNNRINENLELQAQAIFKSWFVDFEPFGGVMPEDWRTGSLSEICGYSKDKVNIEDLTLETYYSTENMQPNRQGAVQATTLPTIKQTTACKKGDVLISNIRPYFKKIIYCFADCGCSTDVLCFVPNKSEYSTFLYCALYSDKFFDYMVAGSKGTKMPRGDKQQIMMYPICIPSTEYVEQFSKIVAPMLEIVYTNRLEANDLAILRDTLLPKLMNGEIDVSEVKI